jgi:hypothetical protein
MYANDCTVTRWDCPWISGVDWDEPAMTYLTAVTL